MCSTCDFGAKSSVGAQQFTFSAADKEHKPTINKITILQPFILFPIPGRRFRC